MVARLRIQASLTRSYPALRKEEAGDLDVGTFFDVANTLGELEWRKAHLDPLLVENDRGYCVHDERAVFASLDAEVARHLTRDSRYFAIDHWFGRREEELWDRASLLRVIGKWAAERNTDAAAKLLCESITQFGERSDLDLLRELSHEVQSTCAEAIANCSYDVRRRSLDVAEPVSAV